MSDNKIVQKLAAQDENGPLPTDLGNCLSGWLSEMLYRRSTACLPGLLAVLLLLQLLDQVGFERVQQPTERSPSADGLEL